MDEMELPGSEGSRIEQARAGGPSAKRLVPAAFVLLILASAALALLRSPYFRVEHVEVRGARALSEDEVVTACELAPDQNIFDVDLGAIADRVRANPRVDKVVARRRLPSTIVVEVVERAAIAVLPYAGYYVQIDGTGLAVGLVETYRDATLPLLSGLSVQQVKVGHAVDARDLPQALDVARVLSEELLDQVSEINFDPEEGFSLYLRGGTRAILGTGGAQEFASRTKVLQAILLKLEEEEDYPAYVDVRYEKRPVVKARR